MGECKRLLAVALAAVLFFSNGFVASEASAAEGESRSDNLLSGDFNIGFESGYSPFALSTAASGGTLSIAEIAGNPAMELRDASLGSNAASLFTARIVSGALFDRINEVYSLPIGTAPAEFVYEFKLERRAASDKPVNKDIKAGIQFGNYDNALIPRFPTEEAVIAGTDAYRNDEPDGNETLEKIDDEDLPGFRFKVVPNGGERKITYIEFRFSVRADTNGTDEAYAVDDLAIYEIAPPAVSDGEAPSSPAGLTVAARTDTTVSLAWSPSTDNVGVTGYNIYRDGAFAGAVNGSTNTYRTIGLSPNTAYSFEVTARDGAGNESAASAPVAATTDPSAGNLPAPFGNADIGSVGVAGSAAYDEGTGAIAVQASGADIWGRDDSFHYVYRPWTGDGEIVARVSAFAAAHSSAKAGVMVRESLTKSSKHALMAVTPASGLVFQRRAGTGGDSVNTNGAKVAAPYWVKLVREDRIISGYSSADGVEWKPVGQQELPMNGTVYVGLAVSSRNNSQLATATFDQVNVRRIQPEQTVIRSAELTEPTGLYVLDADAPPVPAVAVELKNRRSIATSGTVKASILARERTTIWEGEIPFEADAFELLTMTIPTTALTEADYYVLQLEVSEEGASPSGEPIRLAFGAVRPPHEGVKEDSMFGLGLRTEADQAIMQRIAQKIGVKWRRGVKAVDPPIVNPSPGVFWGAEEIAKARQEVLDWQSYGVSSLGAINYNMPWNVAPGPNGEALSRHQNRPLDMAAHVEMVYNSIAPMQDLVKYWELWNEPWVHGWTWKTGDAQDYRDMTRMIWERVKPHFPDVMLIGGGSTSYQRDIVYARGSAHTGYIDGSTNHPYGLPDPSLLAYIKLQKAMDDRWSLGGGQGGMWQTELGTAETLHFADLPQAEQKYGVARTVAPAYLLNKLAAGDTPIRTFWFALSYDKAFSGDTLNIYDGKAPKPAVMAYSAMTHFLEDSELVEELYPQSKSAWGFLFERKDGKATAALYSERGYSGAVTLRGAQNVKVYDYLGKLVAGGGSETVTVALKPWETLYIESELAPQALKAMLTNASFDFEKPLIISPLSLTEPVQPSGTKIDVQVENASSNAISGQLRLVAPEGWALQTNAVQAGPLQPGQKTVLSFPASQTAVSDINRYLVEYAFDVYDESGNVACTQQGKQTIQAAYAPKKTIAVDGDPSDWDDVLPVTMVSNGSRDYLELLLDPSKADEILNDPGSFENVIYTVKTAWDDDYFYFQAQVPDENQASPKPFAEDPYGFAFNADSVQLAFDTIESNPDDLLRGDPHYDKALGSYMDYLFVGTLAQGGVPELHRHTAPGTNMQTYYPTNANFTPPIGPMDVSEGGGTEGKMKVVRDEAARKTTYEIAVAWDAVPELGAQLSALAAGQAHEGKFSFSINDAGTSGKGASQWTKEVGQVQSGAYAFAPFWGTGAIDRGGSLVPRWGFKNGEAPNAADSVLRLEPAEGTYTDSTTLTAVLTDADGSPLEGRTIVFGAASGAEFGSAATDASGTARLVYPALLETDAAQPSAAVPIRATFAGDGGFEPSEDENVLTIAKEEAAIQYTGTTVALQGSPLSLSAQVVQQDDEEAGDLNGLPVMQRLYRLEADGSRVSVSQAVYQTDAAGSFTSPSALDAGLYEVETELLPNSRYRTAAASSTLAIVDASARIQVNGHTNLPGTFRWPGGGNGTGNDDVGSGYGNGNGNGNGNVYSDGDDNGNGIGNDIGNDIGNVNGNGQSKLHIHADLSVGPDGFALGDLRLKTNGSGIDLELQAFDWMVVAGDSAFVQGTAVVQGETYTIRLMLRDRDRGGPRASPDSQSHGRPERAIVSVVVWKTSLSPGDPIYSSPGEPFNGNLSISSGALSLRSPRDQ